MNGTTALEPARTTTALLYRLLNPAGPTLALTALYLGPVANCIKTMARGGFGWLTNLWRPHWTRFGNYVLILALVGARRRSSGCSSSA